MMVVDSNDHDDDITSGPRNVDHSPIGGTINQREIADFYFINLNKD